VVYKGNVTAVYPKKVVVKIVEIFSDSPLLILTREEEKIFLTMEEEREWNNVIFT
jgi:hypothetical protein